MSYANSCQLFLKNTEMVVNLNMYVKSNYTSLSRKIVLEWPFFYPPQKTTLLEETKEVCVKKCSIEDLLYFLKVIHLINIGVD